MHDYKEKLNSLGLKATPQRLSMIDLLMTHGHMSIDAIYDKLKGESASLSLSTVYNNLYALGEKGILREVAISGSRHVYELVKEEHAHLLCNGCGSILDLSVDLEKIQSAATLPKGAMITQSDLIFSGYCPKCAAASKETPNEAPAELSVSL